MIEAQWLFENHLNHLAMEQYYASQIENIINPHDTSNNQDIQSQIFMRPAIDLPPQANHYGSSTERIAVRLADQKTQSLQKEIPKYEKARHYYRFLNQLYNIIIISLTPDEAWLVNAVFIQKHTFSVIRDSPDCPFGPCDRSTIYRNKQRIIRKANDFIQSYIPKEVSACHPNK